MKKPKYALVRITWLDAWAGGEWVDDNDARFHPGGTIVSTVGYRVYSSNKGITVASTVDFEGNVNATMTIPRGMVKRVEVLER